MTDKQKALDTLNKWGYQDPKDNNKVKFHSVGLCQAGDFIEEHYDTLRKSLTAQTVTDDEVKWAVDEAERIMASKPADMNEEYDQQICKMLEILIRAATALKNEPELTTGQYISHCIQDWKFNETNKYEYFGQYLAAKFPNGLKIVE